MRRLAKTKFGFIFMVVLLVVGLLAIPQSPLSVLAAHAQTLFEDGFESGSFTKWAGIYATSGDSATVVSSNPKVGKYHARFQTNGTTSGIEWSVSYYAISPETSEIYERAYFYIANGLPLDDNDDRFGLLAIYDPNTWHAQAIVRIIKVAGVEKFQLNIASGTSYFANATNAIYPQEGVWYCVELYFKVHSTEGEGRVWINGIERITITGKDTSNYGNVKQVRYGLVSVNVQHVVNLYVDAVVIDTKYVGQLYNFAVIGNATAVSELKNIYWMLGNLSITYKTLLPSEVTDETVFNDVDGVISFVSNCGALKNASAVKVFAKTHVIIAHGYDFTSLYYPSFSSSYVLVSGVTTVTYLMDWGAFHINDKTELRRSDNSLRMVLSSFMSGYANITKIAQYNSTYTAFFHMVGETINSGFYVMDLFATRDSTLTANNWHLFPAINYVRQISVGKYARWLANGLSWYSLSWVNNFMQTLANNNPDLVQLYTFGTTVQGRNMYALFIGKGSRYILLDGAMHGDEKTGTAAALRTAELLVQYYNANDSYWRSRLDDYKIVIVPVSNPDGYYANTRENANGKDLNRNYPPDGDEQLTQPESQAFANLLGNYTPTIYLNLHTNLFQMLFYQDSSSPLSEPYNTFALGTWKLANTSYAALKHWGKVSGGGLLGKINFIGQTDLAGPVTEYAWWRHKTISTLIEFYDASPAHNLLGQEYFISIIFTAIQNYDKNQDFQVHSTGEILTTGITTHTYTINLNTQKLQKDSQSKIYVGSQGKPALVVVDGVQKNEGDGWSWNNSTSTITVTGANESILLDWHSISDIKDNIVNAESFKVYFIQTRNTYDAQGIGYFYATTANPQNLRLMDDPLVVKQEDPNRGKPLFGNEAVVLFGGPFAHLCTGYYEKTMQAPLLFTMTAYGSGKWGFTTRDGSTISNAWLDTKDLNGHKDIFIAETFIDSDGNFVVVMYGITQWGTLAAGPYFHDKILPNIDKFPAAWYIFRWEDGINGQPFDSFPQPEEITLIA